MFSKVTLGSRFLLGLIFFVFGLNGLLMFTIDKGFIPTPPPPESMQVIMVGFMATKYLMILVKILEVIAGAFLLSGFFMNAAIVILGPIMVNILGIHVFVERSGMPMALILTVLYLILLVSRWDDFKPLLKK